MYKQLFSLKKEGSIIHPCSINTFLCTLMYTFVGSLMCEFIHTLLYMQSNVYIH